MARHLDSAALIRNFKALSLVSAHNIRNGVRKEIFLYSQDLQYALFQYSLLVINAEAFKVKLLNCVF